MLEFEFFYLLILNYFENLIRKTILLRKLNIVESNVIWCFSTDGYVWYIYQS